MYSVVSVWPFPSSSRDPRVMPRLAPLAHYRVH